MLGVRSLVPFAIDTVPVTRSSVPKTNPNPASKFTITPSTDLHTDKGETIQQEIQFLCQQYHNLA